MPSPEAANRFNLKLRRAIVQRMYPSDLPNLVYSIGRRAMYDYDLLSVQDKRLILHIENEIDRMTEKFKLEGKI